MPMRETVLAHLSWMLTNQRENIAVAALGHILQQSDASKRALYSLLRAEIPEVAGIARVETQSAVEGNRPDLACVNQQGKEHVLVEAKFDAALQPTQPVTYLERLPTNVPSALMVIAPHRRFDELWLELCNRVSRSEGFKLEQKSIIPDVRSVSVGYGRFLVLTGWSFLLEQMMLKCVATGDELAVRDIHQLQGLVELEDATAYHPMPERLDPRDIDLIPQLKELAIEAVREGAQKGCVSTSGLRAGNAPDYYYRRYFRIAGVIAWLGIDFQLWDNHDTPLWFGFENPKNFTKTVRDKLADLRQQNPPAHLQDVPYYSGNQDFIRITIKRGVSHQATLADIVAQLEHIANLLG